MKVLMIGHSCSPLHGSEPGSTWNWASRMCAYHEVWLITYPEYRVETERYLEEHPQPRLHIVWVQVDPRIDPWKPKEGLKGIRLSYLLWQRKAYREARRLHAIHRFDIVHHVSWNSISVPPPARRLGIPFVWGPIGGGQVFPRRYASYIKGHRLTQMIRTARVRSLPLQPLLRATVRHASLVLATNDETISLLRRAGARHVRLFADTGIMPEIVPAALPPRVAGPWLRVFWAGSLDPWKCLPLALEAMAAVNDLPIRLVVAGDGPMREEWETLASRLDLGDRVTFLGRLPWAEMWKLYRESDVFLFTSLKDSFGTVVAEAMGSGLPILTLDHQGVARFVPDTAGIKVPVTTPLETLAGLADGLRFLQSHPQERAAMGQAAWRFARTLTWDERVRLMNGWYAEISGRTRFTGAIEGTSTL